MAMRDTPDARDPLAGVELRQAARFAMTLVTSRRRSASASSGWSSSASRSSASCSTIRPAGRPGRSCGSPPRLRAATRRRTSTLANANGGPGHRRLGQAKAERLQAAAADSIAVPELDAEVAFEVGLLLDQYDLLERQIEARRPPGRGSARRRDGPPAPDDPGRRALDRRDPASPRSATSGASTTSTSSSRTPASIPPNGARARKGSNPETAWHMSKAGNSHLRAAAYRMALVGIQHNPVIAAHYARKRAAGKSQDERPRPLHAQGPRHRLGRLAQRGRLRPRLGGRDLTRPYGI